MANPDDFLRDDQKKARDKAKNTNVTNAFHDRGSMIDKNMSRSQDFAAKQDATDKNKKAEAPKQQSIVQSEEKLKASKAKSSQQSNTLNQQQGQAKTAKEATKTQSATQSEQEKKSKSM